MTRYLLVCCVMLVGCGKAIEQPAQTSKFYRVRVNGADEFKLEDGTRCVAFSAGGITCQWKEKP